MRNSKISLGRITEEGGAKQVRNNRALCINEYFAFKALDNESLKDVYNRFNLSVNKCRRFGVERSSEDINLKFLQSLNPKWSIHVTANNSRSC